jgi:hypothetical protein
MRKLIVIGIISLIGMATLGASPATACGPNHHHHHHHKKPA